MSAISKRWACAKYSHKKMGVGVAGSGAFMLLQGVHADIDELAPEIRLIVASPDLLSAAKQFIAEYDMHEEDEWSPEWRDIGKAFRAAISRAMGVAA